MLATLNKVRIFECFKTHRWVCLSPIHLTYIPVASRNCCIWKQQMKNPFFSFWFDVLQKFFFFGNNQVIVLNLNDIYHSRWVFFLNLCVSNGDFNFYTRFDVDWCDLFHNFAWGVQIDDTLVDAHLETIPSFTTFTARCFTGGDTKYLGWPTNWSLHTEFLLFGTRNQISAHLFQWTNIGWCQRDTNTMNGGWFWFWLIQIFSLSCLK